MADGEKPAKTTTPAPPAPADGAITGRLEKAYRGIGLDQAYREGVTAGVASYRGGNPNGAPPKPAPPLIGAPSNTAPATSPAKGTGTTSNNK